MDNKKKQSFWSSLSFIPAIWALIRWVLSLIGDANTAYNVVTIQGVTIDWVILSCWLATAGLFWIIFVNSEALKKLLIKRKREHLVSAKRVARHIVESSHAKTAFSGKERYSDACKAMRKQILQGSLSVGMLKDGSVHQVKSKVFKNNELLAFCNLDRNNAEKEIVAVIPVRLGSIDNLKPEDIIANDVFFDEVEALKIWPGERSYIE